MSIDLDSLEEQLNDAIDQSRGEGTTEEDRQRAEEQLDAFADEAEDSIRPRATDETLTPENCPPDSFDDQNEEGGEEFVEPFDFPNLNYSNFLTPITEIDTTPYSGEHSIRELNIFDEFFFLRTSQDILADFQSIALVPGFHNQSLSQIYKLPRIRPEYDIIGEGTIETKQVEIDRFRIDNNRFWLLRGTEQAPRQDAWAEWYTITSLQQPKYSITLEPMDVPVISNPNADYAPDLTRIKIEFSDFENTSVEYMSDFYESKMKPGTVYRDFNTSVPQPLFASELSVESSTLEQELLAKKSYVVDFKPFVSKQQIDPEEIAVPETRMRSLYRDYFLQQFNAPTDCNIDDVIQKFLSSNIAQMDEANDSSLLGTSHPNYIEISIKRPEQQINQHGLVTRNPILDNIIDGFNDTQIDKYYLELITGYKNFFHYKKFVQIADETTPGGVQLYRTNDRFAVSFMRTFKQDKDFITLPKMLSEEEELGNHVENVVNNSEQYPFRFNNHNNPQQLLTDDTINVGSFSEKLSETNSIVLRNFSGIFAGKKAHSCIIGYKIQKFSGRSTPIQEFLIMERPRPFESISTPPIRFLDTQVKYGKTYTYKIYSIALVYGNMYQYASDPAISPWQDGPTIEGQVQSNQYAKLIEVPFIQKTISLTDLPPLPPEVTFAPFQGVSDRMRVVLNHSVGSRKEKPIKILDTDQSIIQQMRRAQPDIENGEAIQYYSDTIPQEYQMFMSVTPPDSYGSMIQQGSTFVPIPTNGNISVVYELPQITPNQEYYITFRSAEVAGISNPGPVFKVRMVDTPNGVFMILREYDMYLQKETYTKLDFQRALKISPSALQRSIAYPEGTDLGSREFALSAPHLPLSVGPETNSIWGKKYKFRITSKTSGKKIDLNIGFEQNTTENLPDTLIIQGPCEPPRLSLQEEPTDPTPPPQPEPEPVPEPVTRCLPELDNLPTIRGPITSESTRYQPNPCPPRHINLGSIALLSDEVFAELGGTESSFGEYEIDLNNLQIGPEKKSMTFTEWLKSIPGLVSTQFFQCPDGGPTDLIDFLPAAAYEQATRASSGEDYRVIFNTEPGQVPPHLQDELDKASKWNLVLQANDPDRGSSGFGTIISGMKTEQLDFWSATSPDPVDLAEIQNMQPGNQSIADAAKVFLETEWDPSIVDDEGNRVFATQYKFLYFIRRLIFGLGRFGVDRDPDNFNITIPSLGGDDTSLIVTVPRDSIPFQALEAFDKKVDINNKIRAKEAIATPGCSNGGVWDPEAPNRLFPNFDSREFGDCVHPGCQDNASFIHAHLPCNGCECDPGFELDDETGECVPVTEDCPAGKVRNSDGECVEIPTCGPCEELTGNADDGFECVEIKPCSEFNFTMKRLDENGIKGTKSLESEVLDHRHMLSNTLHGNIDQFLGDKSWSIGNCQSKIGTGNPCTIQETYAVKIPYWCPRNPRNGLNPNPAGHMDRNFDLELITTTGPNSSNQPHRQYFNQLRSQIIDIEIAIAAAVMVLTDNEATLENIVLEEANRLSDATGLSDDQEAIAEGIIKEIVVNFHNKPDICPPPPPPVAKIDKEKTESQCPPGHERVTVEDFTQPLGFRQPCLPRCQPGFTRMPGRQPATFQEQCTNISLTPGNTATEIHYAVELIPFIEAYTDLIPGTFPSDGPTRMFWPDKVRDLSIFPKQRHTLGIGFNGAPRLGGVKGAVFEEMPSSWIQVIGSTAFKEACQSATSAYLDIKNYNGTLMNLPWHNLINTDIRDRFLQGNSDFVGLAPAPAHDESIQSNGWRLGHHHLIDENNGMTPTPSGQIGDGMYPLGPWESLMQDGINLNQTLGMNTKRNYGLLMKVMKIHPTKQGFEQVEYQQSNVVSTIVWTSAANKFMTARKGQSITLHRDENTALEASTSTFLMGTAEDGNGNTVVVNAAGRLGHGSGFTEVHTGLIGKDAPVNPWRVLVVMMTPITPDDIFGR